jgi:hypothetical protein
MVTLKQARQDTQGAVIYFKGSTKSAANASHDNLGERFPNAMLMPL